MLQRGHCRRRENPITVQHGTPELISSRPPGRQVIRLKDDWNREA